MSEWRETTLGELIDVSHGFAFRGEFFGEGGDRRLVTPGNFFEAGGFRDRGPSQKSYEGPIPERYVLRPGEVVVAMTEQASGLLGSSGLVPSTGTWLHNQRIGRVSARDGSASEKFIYYLFNSAPIRAQISATATGAKVRHTAPERIFAVRATVPDRSTQARIATVLGAFDELIAINERRIEVLEDLARSLYREWFVRDSLCIEPIRDDHPSATIAMVADLLRGSINPAKSPATIYEHFSIPAFDARQLPAIEDGASIKSSKTQISGECVLLSKLNPRIPRVWFALPQTNHAITSTEFLAWRGTGVSTAWLWATFSSNEFLRRLAGTAGGTSTSHQRVKSADVASYPIDPPDPENLRRFDAIADPALREGALLRRQNHTLTDTRDLLLPRLVTGRLDISDLDLGDLLAAEAS